ncbi:DDE_3 domain-containing protein [Trichonephila clavipes]|nr:DDE_3 domain-containing protein [Trichonephila clavipes]
MLCTTREKRANAGSKMASLLENEDADDFYQSAYGGFADEADDAEYSEEDEVESDTDTDISIDENDEPVSDQEEEATTKRKHKVVTKAYKEPTAEKVKKEPKKHVSKANTSTPIVTNIVSTGFLPTSGNLECDRLGRVIFSDESRFSLSADDHRTRVWRRTGQRSDPAFIVERHTAISQGVTVGSNFLDTRSSLVVPFKALLLTAQMRVDDILTPIVLPMLSSRPGAIYQQDNARPHTARLSQQCLQGMTSLPWPARSPDLSPIEHVWTLGRQLQPIPRYEEN